MNAKDFVSAIEQVDKDIQGLQNLKIKLRADLIASCPIQPGERVTVTRANGDRVECYLGKITVYDFKGSLRFHFNKISRSNTMSKQSACLYSFVSFTNGHHTIKYSL